MLGGSKPEEHRLLAEHVTGVETWIATEGHGRTIHEWRAKLSRPDNHRLDCLVGCAVAAAISGNSLGVEFKTKRRQCG